MLALLEATRDVLRTNLATNLPNVAANINFYVDIQPEGHPPNFAGQWYVSIDEGGVSSDSEYFLREKYTVKVWITRRTGVYPKDRAAKAYSDSQEGMETIERQVIDILHANETIRLTANTYAAAPGAGGDEFIRPLYYKPGRTTTHYMGSDWIPSNKEVDPCMVRELTFEGADRIQAYDVMAGSVLSPSELTANPG